MAELSWRGLPGWFHFREFYDRVIAALPPGGVMVELGVYHGASLVYAAEKIQARGGDVRLVGVDICAQCPYETLMANLQRCGVNPEIITSLSWEAAQQFADESVDLVFVDASHYYLHVLKDITAWMPKIKPGGLIAGDDYGDPSHPGVKRAVDEFFLEELQVQEQIWSFRK